MIRLTVNGEERTAEVAGAESLLTVLREQLGLPGSKSACEQGECGSCTVIMDGAAVCSCLVLGSDAAGADIRTVEGVASPGTLAAVQEAMLGSGGVQCGFCTPGIVVVADHLFATNPHPDVEEIREALAGNICRCTGYGSIVRALSALAGNEP
jgi:carbon-monoxide dehydrogenase small subunit